MAQNPIGGKLLYHITAFDNLESIIINDLSPRQDLTRFTDIADADILKDREKFNLQEYTPFHFFAGSPFAGSVQINNPETEFVYITIKRTLAQNKNFHIIPRHPLNYDDVPMSWDEGLVSIEWDVMATRDYKDHLCKEICMAEAIFKGKIPFNSCHCIYVRNQNIKDRVLLLLQKHNCSGIYVDINQTMFIRND